MEKKQDTKETESPESKTTFPLFIVWQSLLVILLTSALLGMGLSLTYIKQLKKNAAQQTEGVAQQINNVTQLVTLQQSRVEQLTQQLSQAQKTLGSLEYEKSQPQKKWQFNEAAHLLTLAKLNLDYHHNISGTMQLIQAAIQQFPKISDPDIIRLQQQLTDAIISLKEIAKKDQTALLTTLSTLMQQIEQLPLHTKSSGAAIEKDEIATSGWRQVLQNSWASLQKIIVIRRIEQTKQVLIMPSQRLAVDASLQLALQQVQWAILQSDSSLYSSSLEQATRLINNYFEPNAPMTKNFITTLAELKSVELKPKLPDLSNSLDLLHSIIEKFHQED